MKVCNVRCGRLIISGTSIPVWLIAVNWEGSCTPREFLEHYHQLTLVQLYDALSYYYDHPKEIKAQIREHDLSDEELATLQAQWPP